MKKWLTYFFLLAESTLSLCFAQPPRITIDLVYQNQNLELKKYYSFSNKDSIRFDQLKFYLSHFTLLNNGEIVFKDKREVYLIDAASGNNIPLPIKISKKIIFNEIQFFLGVDSATNTSGAMGGDLDPVNNMYWTWQSGYINFKLEGSCSILSNPNKSFELHLGGYKYPFNALQKIKLSANTSAVYSIEFDLNKFIDTVLNNGHSQVMTPSNISVELSDQAASSFRIKNAK